MYNSNISNVTFSTQPLFSSFFNKRKRFVKQHNIHNKTIFDLLSIIPLLFNKTNKISSLVYQTKKLINSIVCMVSFSMSIPIPTLIRHIVKTLKNKNSSYKPDKDEKTKLHSFIKNNRNFPIVDFTNWLLEHSYFKNRVNTIQDVLDRTPIWYHTRTGCRRINNKFRDENKFKIAFAIFHRYRDLNTPEKYISVGNACYIEFVDGDRYEILCVVDPDFEAKATALFNEWKGV